MLEGLYSAASGMEAQQQQFDAISNDMANLDTPGYQSTIVGFHDLLYSNGAYGSNVATGAGTAAARSSVTTRVRARSTTPASRSTSRSRARASSRCGASTARSA